MCHSHSASWNIPPCLPPSTKPPSRQRLLVSQVISLPCICAFLSDKDTGAIDHYKSTKSTKSPAPDPSSFRRSNTYVNPNYKPPQAPSRPLSRHSKNPTALGSSSSSDAPRPTAAPCDVLLGGVAFRSSGRSLVRKDRASSQYRKVL